MSISRTQGMGCPSRKNRPTCALLFAALLFLSACAAGPETVQVKETAAAYPAGTIIRTDDEKTISESELFKALIGARIVYVGEQHNNPYHHGVQLDIIKALQRAHSGLMIGMEMFDRTYDPILADWTAGRLDETEFLEKTHWYANWRYGFSLYREILIYARDNRIPVVGLNLPFHIPPKIAVGGIENLPPEDREHLPAVIDTTDTAHRAYVESIFQRHKIRGRDKFDFFYAAQCAWEDVMAESVARWSADHPMVVLAGNGHIYQKFGIPQRAYSLNHLPFQTVYLVPVGREIDLPAGDYIWVTPKAM